LRKEVVRMLTDTTVKIGGKPCRASRVREHTL
jgi:hypothetical protein